MNWTLIAVFAIFLLVAVSDVSARCCGRGKHGFCNDCAKTSWFGHRKCCGKGSGRGHGCNVFCCGCIKCRKGHPAITFHSGWIFHKRYKCTQYGDENEDMTDLKELEDTWAAFSEIDRDQDNVISSDEFLDAIKLKFSDHDEAGLVASDILDTEDRDEIIKFLDEVNENEELDTPTMKMIMEEFQKMDQNNDGQIQAVEFDKDLN